MRPIIVHDLRGCAVGFLDGDRLRDDHGKPVAERDGNDAQTRTLADRASGWMNGRKVLMDLAIGDVATAATHADFGIPEGDYVADKVSPVRYVKHDRGVWYPESAADAITLVLPTGNDLGSPNEVNPIFSPASFTTTGYALAARIPRLVRGNADFDLKARALFRVVEALRLGREQRVATLLTTATNWATANRVAATSNWNGGAGANPLGDLFNALKASYLPATTLILPENVAQSFYVQPQASTGIRDYVQADGEMPKRLYARAKKLVAGVPQYVWAPAAAANVALVRMSDDPKTLVTSVTLRWLGEGQDGEARDGILVREFFDSKTDSDWIVAAHNDSEVFVSNQVGAVITGATA